MKIGDLVRRRDAPWLAIILAIKEFGPAEGWDAYPEFMWLDTGEIDTCHLNLLEVLSETVDEDR